MTKQVWKVEKDSDFEAADKKTFKVCLALLCEESADNNQQICDRNVHLTV